MPRPRVLVAALLLAATGCSEGQKTPAVRRPLYERLGGERVLMRVVNDYFAPQLKEQELDVAKLIDLKIALVEQLGELTGGPQRYRGTEFKGSLKLLAQRKEWLRKVLDNNQVAAGDRDDLLEMLPRR
jgi:hypothetical protein